MSSYAVEPDALRAVSATVDALADSVQTPPTSSCVDVGHAGLSGAVSGFEQDGARIWGSRHETTAAVARGLVRTAGIFEAADDDAASSVRVNAGAL